MRGRRPLRTPFFSLPPRRGFAGAGAPAPPGASRQTWLLAPPHEWAYPAHTRGSFRFTTKGTKGVPGAAPLDPGAWLPHFPRSLRFAPARAVLPSTFLPAALQARQHGGHIPPRLSPPPFGTLIACGFPFPYSGKKLLRARWGAQAVHNRRGPIRVRKRTPETKGKTLFYILYSINLFLIEIVVFRFQEADKWRS